MQTLRIFENFGHQIAPGDQSPRNTRTENLTKPTTFSLRHVSLPNLRANLAELHIKIRQSQRSKSDQPTDQNEIEPQIEIRSRSSARRNALSRSVCTALSSVERRVVRHCQTAGLLQEQKLALEVVDRCFASLVLLFQRQQPEMTKILFG